MIRHQYGRLFALAGVAALMLTSRCLQAATSMAAATMTLTSVVAHDPPTNALLHIYVDDGAIIHIGRADMHPVLLAKPRPHQRVYNLRHLPPHERRSADVSATYTFHTAAGGKQPVTLTKNVVVQAGEKDEVRFTYAEFARARTFSRIPNPVVLYEFHEGGGRMVFDQSKNSSPLDLYIHDATKTRWSNHGLQVNGPVLIASVRPAKELISALKAKDAITIEAWIEPENLRQQGPARIVSLSDGTSVRNFTLGQENNRYDVRLRTSQRHGNGLPSVSTHPKVVSTKLTHVVYTRFKTGEVRIYVDGKIQGGAPVPGSFSGWDDRFHLLLGNETSLDRTWLGWYYLVAIYDRALTPDEVQRNFLARP